MNITGIKITEACVIDCGQVVTPGDNAVVFEFVMRCDAVAMCYLKEVIEAALANVAKHRLPSPQDNLNPRVKGTDVKTTA